MPQLCTFGASSARGFGLTEETGLTNDEQFNLTTLLLPGNGTNGAQNNTFLDSSTNNFTVTRNGTPTQGTFSPFSFGGGTAQANGYYSGYLNGSSYFTAPGNTAFAFGTGAFTIEMWLYVTAYPANYAVIPSNRTYNAGSTDTWGVFFFNTGAVRFSDVNNTQTFQTSAGAVPLNVWTHLAVVRNSTASNDTKIYINGTSVAQGTINSNFSNNTNAVVFGTSYDSNNWYVTSYASNLRIVKGTAVYTANFTVPTTPLTNITNTSLLTCQSSQFIDNSANAFTITVNGNPQPTVVNPFGMTDWSGYFDGSGDYLSVANNAAFLLATNNFTIEFWVYPTNVSSTQSILSKGAGGYSPFLIQNSSGSGLIYISSAGSAWDVASGVSLGTIPISTWTHIAITREGNTFKTFKNGIQVSTFSSSASLYNPANPVTIGYNGGAYPEAFYGNISNLRIVNGTAVYTSNFTVPTAPLTAITNTTLLTCQSSTFIDNSTNAFAITVNGNAYTGTLNNPFNSIVNYTTPPLQAWSNYFDGTGDYLSVASNAAFGVGSGDFTIECWIYLTQNFDATGQGVVTASYNTNFAIIGTNSGAGNKIDFYVANSILSTGTNYISLNTWTHLAFVRLAGTTRIYFNGVQVASSGSLTGTGAAAALYVGTLSHDLNQEMTGYISNVRLVKGTAVYTAAFTPPTAPLTATANTSLLTCQSNNFVDNSINRFAITRNGDTSVQPFSPFQPAVPYSTTSVGGSGFFGVGNYFSLANNTALTMGASDFTMEAWVYPTAFGAFDLPLVVHRPIVSANGIVWGLALTTGLPFLLAGDSNTSAWNITLTGSTAATLNAWNHVALTRNGSTWTLWLNGASVASGSASFTMEDTGTLFVYGADVTPSSAPFTGYSAGFRMVKGTSLYNTSFVPPTSPPTAVTNTQLLLNYTNAGIPDATAKNVLETVGNAQISTAQSKFGGSSMEFDGAGDYIVQPTNFSYGYGTGDFTIEFWLRLNTTSIQTIVSNLTSAASTNPHIYINSTLRYYTANADRITGASLSAGQWYHIAVCRASGSTRLFVNGTQSGSTYTDANNYGTTAPLGIGTYWSSGSPVTSQTLNGYIDDLRITKYARYTTNFTPPTSAFPLI